jgi:hypothetical protein
MTPIPKYLTQDEIKRFFAAIDSPRDKALFGLIYHYGLRVQTTSEHCLPPWGMKPTVLDQRHLLDLHTLTLMH